ncbi:hypothetical protein SeLEV6574_g00089 [Synchytrium endobioticum]|uniref:Uncharacterized protein n=1 Tax=Synchytrium endobioticum TaxID=286115 RepID=A0A507DJR4_9FUNG|nr:hypothetical protein SeLEV6574_g00089 [Synchytrium endobioticum]
MVKDLGSSAVAMGPAHACRVSRATVDGPHARHHARNMSWKAPLQQSIASNTHIPASSTCCVRSRSRSNKVAEIRHRKEKTTFTWARPGDVFDGVSGDGDVELGYENFALVVVVANGVDYVNLFKTPIQRVKWELVDEQAWRWVKTRINP